MRHLGSLLVIAVIASACGKVERGGDDGSPGGDRSDARPVSGDGGSALSDAGGPDATPVACNGPEDCTSPDDPCLLPGTCEGDVCRFPEKDCSDLDGECTRGVCNNAGDCEARAIREDQGCGDGVMDCGGFGACGGFDGICGESGTQSRTCRDSTCQSGTCVTGAAYTDTRGCSRDTDGTQCGTTTYDCPGFCNYPDDCANSADPLNCVQTDFACAGGGCSGFETSYQEPCERDTEGLPCGSENGCCSPGGVCFPSCV